MVSINKIRVAAGIIKVRWYWKDMLSSHTQDLSTIIYVTLKRYLHINAKFNYLSTIIYVTLKWYLHINSKFVTMTFKWPDVTFTNTKCIGIEKKKKKKNTNNIKRCSCCKLEHLKKIRTISRGGRAVSSNT